MILRVSEVYTSIQGEGPFAGSPCQFVRFGGCNLRCPAWPCDTQHAIDPAYRAEWEHVEPGDLFDRVSFGPKHVVLTGGEPFLQNSEALEFFVRKCRENDFLMEAFTNGALPWPRWPHAVHKVMDWKLPGSGENYLDLRRLTNIEQMTTNDSVKFTVADGADFELATELWDEHFNTTDKIRRPKVFVGAAWGKVTEAEVAKWLIESQLPWNLNVQIHNYIWDREKRGI